MVIIIAALLFGEDNGPNLEIRYNIFTTAFENEKYI